MAGSVLASCAADVANENSSTLMVDCQFQANNHVHMHVYEERGAVTLVTGYTPGKESGHFEDLRSGIESKGRLISSAGHRLAIDMYLLNDHFGENPGEVVRIRVGGDGRSKMEARGIRGVVRTIDTGTCTLPDAGQHQASQAGAADHPPQLLPPGRFMLRAGSPLG